MYARTKFEIEEIIKEDNNYYEVRNKTTINKYTPLYLDKSDVIKLSDNIKDLCDEFIIANKNNTFIWRGITDFDFAKLNCEFDRDEKIFGIITRYDGVKVKVAQTNYSRELSLMNSIIYTEE